jgi:hypothetical protein
MMDAASAPIVFAGMPPPAWLLQRDMSRPTEMAPRYPDGALKRIGIWRALSLNVIHAGASVNRIQKAISLILLLLPSSLAAQVPYPVDQFRKMVADELKSQEREGDVLGTPLVIRSLVADEADFLIVPVSRDGRLVSLFRDDIRRSWVKEAVSPLALERIRADLLTAAGAAAFLDAKKIHGGRPLAISLGPFSLFGTVGAGWYIATGKSFYLLSFEGKLLEGRKVARLWPGQARLLKALGETPVSKPEADE